MLRREGLKELSAFLDPRIWKKTVFVQEEPHSCIASSLKVESESLDVVGKCIPWLQKDLQISHYR